MLAARLNQCFENASGVIQLVSEFEALLIVPSCYLNTNEPATPLNASCLAGIVFERYF